MNEPDRNAGDVDPHIAEIWAEALETVGEVFAKYADNTETSATMCRWLTYYMTARQEIEVDFVCTHVTELAGTRVFHGHTVEMHEHRLEGSVPR